MSAECTIQDVFNRFYPKFEKKYSLSAVQRKAAYHIMNCKTAARNLLRYLWEERNACREYSLSFTLNASGGIVV